MLPCRFADYPPLPRVSAQLHIALICILLALCPFSANAGAGTSVLAIFEPRTSSTILQSRTVPFTDSITAATWKRMNDFDVWGVELLIREAVTSAALEHIHTAAPTWTRDYTPGWKALLNTNELISYGAIGEWEISPQDGRYRARYELIDFILNHRISSFQSDAPSQEDLAAAVAERLLAELQLYFAEVIDVSGREVVLNIGPEALTTGTVLTAYAHGHFGHHPPFYPPHGHREEDDHFYGSKVYDRYRDTLATSASVHSHSRSLWRHLQKQNPAAYADMITLTVGGSPYTHTTAPLAQVDPATGLRPQEQQLINAAHFYSGRPTGTITITHFQKPSPYFNQQYAIGTLTQGFAVPGGFVRKKE